MHKVPYMKPVVFPSIASIEIIAEVVSDSADNGRLKRKTGVADEVPLKFFVYHSGNFASISDIQ